MSLWGKTNQENNLQRKLLCSSDLEIHQGYALFNLRARLKTEENKHCEVILSRGLSNVI